MFGISPKINLLLQIIFFSIFSFYFRTLIYRKSRFLLSKPVIFIGENKYLDNLYKIIKSNPQLGYNVVGLYPNEKENPEENLKLKNLLIVFDKMPNFSDEEISKIYNDKIEVTDIIKAYDKLLQKIPVDIVDGDWILNNIKMKKDVTYDIARKIIDVTFATLVLIITSPLLIVAILARLIEDGRPIFIEQKRVGKNGKIFSLYKIRSMVAMFPNGLAETNDSPKWAEENDPRITKVGRILRKTHMDEISQMVNILKGDITLVGPRPEHPLFVLELENAIPHYKIRHIVKPGFTGCYARSVEDSKEKFEYDLYYTKNKNLFLDIEVILKTLRIMLTH
jgi:lipopolysaccharide/colanic/teichoic acid biosynthesis glycosyltransferase